MYQLIVPLFFTLCLAKHEDYAGWKSYRIQPSSIEQLNGLLEADLAGKFLGIPNIVREGLVAVSPKDEEKFLELVKNLNITYHQQSSDLKTSFDLDDDAIWNANNEAIKRGDRLLPFDNYQELDVIYDYLEDIARRNQETVTLVDAGRSFEGIPLKYIKISTSNSSDSTFPNSTTTFRRKPLIIIEGGLRALEWPTIPVASYAIHKLVENVTEPDMLDNFDWIILPVVNPDGYNFSYNTNRIWSKTRSIDQPPISDFCIGVGANNNFDIAWNTTGVYNNPCADNYPGGRSFSESETRVVRDIIRNEAHRATMYISLRSSGNMIMYPWGYTQNLSNNALDLHVIGISMADRIDNVSTIGSWNYRVGHIASMIPAESGTSADYAHANGIPLVYTIALPGVVNGTVEGIYLRPSVVEEVGRETWEGLVVGARRAYNLYGGGNFTLDFNM